MKEIEKFQNILFKRKPRTHRIENRVAAQVLGRINNTQIFQQHQKPNPPQKKSFHIIGASTLPSPGVFHQIRNTTKK